MQEDAAIERLVLGADDGKAKIGIEVFAGHVGQPQRHIGQFRKALHLVRIGDETRGVDDDLALIELRKQDLAKSLGRAGLAAIPASAR